MGIEEGNKKKIQLSFYRNQLVVKKGELMRTEPQSMDEDVLKTEKLNHLSKRIKLIEYAIDKYKLK